MLRAAVVKAEAVRKAGKMPKATVVDQISALVRKSKKGIDINTLRKKVSTSENNLRISLYRMKKKGLIKSVSKGVYVRS